MEESTSTSLSPGDELSPPHLLPKAKNFASSRLEFTGKPILTGKHLSKQRSRRVSEPFFPNFCLISYGLISRPGFDATWWCFKWVIWSIKLFPFFLAFICLIWADKILFVVWSKRSPSMMSIFWGLCVCLRVGEQLPGFESPIGTPLTAFLLFLSGLILPIGALPPFVFDCSLELSV